MHNHPKPAPSLSLSQSPQSQSQVLIDKIIHLQNCHTKSINQFHMKVQYITTTREINISKALQKIHSQGFKIENSQIFFQNYEMKMYMYLGTFPFQHQVYLKHQYCIDATIKIKYKKIIQSPKNNQSHPIPSSMHKQKQQQKKQPFYNINANKSNNNTYNASNTYHSACSSNQVKKPRPKQRTIGQVVQIVKTWRQLCSPVSAIIQNSQGQTLNQGSKPHTLSSAAQHLGISKKTLQDYAYQVQLGHQFGFNFQKNNDSKIGVLRKFVKQKRKQMVIINNMDNYFNLQTSSHSSQDDNHMFGSK